MTKLEMIEALRTKANVSYEEAKDVLELSGEDLLDAIILLEKQGKLKAEDFRMDPENDKQQGEGTDTVREEQNAVHLFEDRREDGETGREEGAQGSAEDAAGKYSRQAGAGSFGQAVRKGFDFVLHTSLRMTRADKEVLSLPTWLVALVLPGLWEIIIPAMVIGLFFGYRFSFDGRGKIEEVNDFLKKAEGFASEVEKEAQNVV